MRRNNEISPFLEKRSIYNRSNEETTVERFVCKVRRKYQVEMERQAMQPEGIPLALKCEGFGMTTKSKKLKVATDGVKGSLRGHSEFGLYSGNSASLPKLLRGY